MAGSDVPIVPPLQEAPKGVDRRLPGVIADGVGDLRPVRVEQPGGVDCAVRACRQVDPLALDDLQAAPLDLCGKGVLRGRVALKAEPLKQLLQFVSVEIAHRGPVREAAERGVRTG